MKLELKKIKHAEYLSQETPAYSAVVYVDGKPAINVMNEGHGGPDNQYAIGGENRYARVNEVNQWCIDNLPKRPCEYSDNIYDTDLEAWCMAQLDEWLVLKDMNKALRSRLLYIEKPDDTAIYQTRIKGARSVKPHLARLVENVTKDYPDAVILNTLPVHKALEIWKGAAT